ncbi:hypothetical protein BTM36_19445 [Herbaspirillum sp. VT-16-41]|nr:hypothetical protein BTM36_19445 [Herbaspirillum sp. VT-16-41]
MDIVGGVYSESCEVPFWNAELGSGGRAAAAISKLSPHSTLHTYAKNFSSRGLTQLKEMGIALDLHRSDAEIAFAYFHPLSRPHIEPRRSEISRNRSIQVSARTVLRFGMLEGDAIVDAEYAVYDPQTLYFPEPYRDNGSKARQLAILLNRAELRAITRKSNIGHGAREVQRTQGAQVVVVKDGPYGAWVVEGKMPPHFIPAYYSSKVFKIGSGDVFSAIFSFYWGEENRCALEAADLASRTVSQYSTKPMLPVDSSLEGCTPVFPRTTKHIFLNGYANTLGRRYSLEEARHRLEELGAVVSCPVLDRHNHDISLPGEVSELLIADGFPDDALQDRMTAVPGRQNALIILAEDRAPSLQEAADNRLVITDDFSSAIYLAIWGKC